MSKFNGITLVSGKLLFRYVLPALMVHPQYWYMFMQQIRKHLRINDPDKNYPICQIHIRCNEVCNLRCPSCGQWGENGWLLAKKSRGEKLNSLSWETVKNIIYETKKDRPFYYIWGGEPTLWEHLLPLFQELGKNNLLGSIVTNCHILEPFIEPLIDTGALSNILISLDGWNAESQNRIRKPAGNRAADNFERTMKCIDKIDEYKKKLRTPLPLIMPITVISNYNYMHLAEIHEIVREKTQLHVYYYGWFITEERANQHDLVFEKRYGTKPYHHRGYIKSVFNDVDPEVTAQQVHEVYRVTKGYPSIPQFFPDITSKADIKRYYDDHNWTVGYSACHSIYYIMEISPDGRVTPCRDYQDYECGNVNEQSVYEIWNGEKYKKFRREMKKGLMPVCSRCCGLQGL